MSLKSRNKVSVAFSMSSMTDIVFLLLIFFMITSTLVHPTALKLVLPQASSTKTNEKKAIVQIFISSNLQYSIKSNKKFRNFKQADLESILSDITVTDDSYMSLHPDENVPIENVVEVMDLAKTKGLKLALKTSITK